MKKKFPFILVISVVLIFFFLPKEETKSWGFYGHKRINRMAVFTLPPEMITFYKKNIEFLTEHAVDPDKRRYAIEDEAARHYIDIDHYGPDAFKEVPMFWGKAVEKFTEDTLKAYGINPWHINVMVLRLADAFKKEDVDRILHISADLGHYVGDAHVPLHTTENYNGQMTGQRGIHGFWESRIPELKAEDYDYFVGRAKYIDSPIKRAWKIIKESNAAVDSVLKFEAELNAKYPTDKKYGFEQRGNMTVKIYSQDYTEAYDEMIKGQVERRMRASIAMVGSFWYTAWVNGGKPDLNKMGDREISDSLKKVLAKEEELYQQMKIKNPKGHDD
ncbi:MAG: S1/P1 Nuclease [Bacteroidia bacterium]|nr:S1/P1 Nuclease [Bacteroidia bacterium]